MNVDGKPLTLPNAIHDENPLSDDVEDPTGADFNGTNLTFAHRSLNVHKIMYKNTINVGDWLNYFPNFQPKGPSIDLKINPKIKEVFLATSMDAIKNQLNKLHAIGDTKATGTKAYLKHYDGFATLIDADPDAVFVGTAAVLTVDNILDRIDALRQAVPLSIRQSPDLIMFCSIKAFDLYYAARAKSQTQIPVTDVKANSMIIQAFGAGIKLVAINGLADDFVFATIASHKQNSNLTQGVWVDGDTENMQIMKRVNTDTNYKMLMRFHMGVQYKTGKDIVYINSTAKP